jgi:hypothetical protein
MTLLDVGETICRYARSAKYWVGDPQCIAWEQFHMLNSIPTFGESEPVGQQRASAWCAGSAPRGQPVSIPVTGASSGSCC